MIKTKKFFLAIILVFIIELYPVSAASPTPETIANALKIENLRAKSYPGSNIKIEKKLATQKLYYQYIASYKSDGLKIYGLLTIPKGTKPVGGWPAIIFNHGYIQPEVYTTTGRYVAYVDAFAKSGYIVFKPDYRGHGKSGGLPEGVYYSPAYTIDVLNALTSVKKLSSVNSNKIGMWGHSMGGHITINSLAINQKDIKAAVIWGGVVGSYTDIMFNWPDRSKTPFHGSPRDISVKYQYRKKLLDTFGSPVSSTIFWDKIDALSFIKDFKTPIQLEVGESDLDVPPEFSESFYNKLKSENKIVEYYSYPGGNHNISSPNFEIAMQRSITFFDKYLK